MILAMAWETFKTLIRQKPIGAEFTIKAFSIYPSNEHNIQRFEQLLRELCEEGILEIVDEGRYRRVERNQ